MMKVDHKGLALIKMTEDYNKCWMKHCAGENLSNLCKHRKADYDDDNAEYDTNTYMIIETSQSILLTVIVTERYYKTGELIITILFKHQFHSDNVLFWAHQKQSLLLFVLWNSGENCILILLFIILTIKEIKGRAVVEKMEKY